MTTRLHGGVLAAVFLSAVLTCWGVSTALAYTAGSGASGSVTIPTYTNVAAYLARSDTSEVGHVQIGTRVYPEYRIRGVAGLTDATLVATYANVAAWQADANREDKLFAVIGGNLYATELLKNFNDAGILSDTNLPYSETQSPDPETTAVGDGAIAGKTSATAVGENAQASDHGAVAIGRDTNAAGAGSIAIGDYVRAYGVDSIALGHASRTSGRGAIATGIRSTGYGEGAATYGYEATAIGDGALALGQRSVAAALDAGQSIYDVVPEGLHALVECASGKAWDPSDTNANGLVEACGQFLTSSEKSNSNLNANTAAGRTFRQGILTRLQTRLNDLKVEGATAIGDGALATASGAVAVGQGAEALDGGATAVGNWARATAERATAVGSSARAGDRSTAVGHYANARGTRSTAIGHYALVLDDRSVSMGHYAIVKGEQATAVGTYATAHGKSVTVLGHHAKALGEGALAIGRGAEAAKVAADQYLYQVLPGGSNADVGTISDCAYDPWVLREPGRMSSSYCSSFLTDAERNNADIDADSAAGRTLRAAVRTRLAGLLDGLAVRQATAIGTWARASEDYATAMGNYAQAVGAASTAVGNAAVAGTWATAAGQLAFATGRYGAALGSWAQAHGENSIAIGGDSTAGGVSVGSDMVDRWIYVNVDEYLANADRASDTSANVIIGGKIYSVSALENVHSTAMGGLTRDNLPAPLVGKSGAIAIGQESRAAETDSIALGRAAVVSGVHGIAIGAGVTATTNQAVIGTSDHSYVLPGIAASQATDTEVVTVGSDGALAADGGALHRRVGSLEGGLGATGDGADAEGSVYARIKEVRESLGTAAASADADGNAYERIKALREVVDTASSEEFAKIGAANVLTQVRALDDAEIERVVERVARQTPQTVKIRTGSGEERTVVKLTGASNEQIMALVALLTDNRLSTTPVIGEDGKPVGTTMTEFLALDAEKALAEASLTPEQRTANAAAAKERLAYLFQALYGAPYGETGIADPATDSDTPHGNSIVGRLDNIDDFMPRSEDGTLEEAPVDTDGEVPAGVTRSVVVQDVYTENGRQRVVLRSLDLGRLAGVDRRVDALDQRVTGLAHGLAALDQRVDEAIAMTSALTALPNVVPGAKQFFLGAGTGFYRGEEAFSLGLAARLDADRRGRQQVYVNAGVASGYTGDGFTGRIGMGIAW